MSNGKQQDKNQEQKNLRSENAERLFLAMSGVDEELLARSEESAAEHTGTKTGKIHRFPIGRTSRIAAACLCFVVVGAVFVTVSTYGWRAGKNADSSGAAMDVAMQNEAAAAPVENEAAMPAEAAYEDTQDGAEAAEVTAADATGAIPEEALSADTTAGVMADGKTQNSLAASKTENAAWDRGDEQKQAAQQDAGNSGAVPSVSDSDSAAGENISGSAAPGESTEALDKTPQLREKAPRRMPEKMKK